MIGKRFIHHELFLGHLKGTISRLYENMQVTVDIGSAGSEDYAQSDNGVDPV